MRFFLLLATGIIILSCINTTVSAQQKFNGCHFAKSHFAGKTTLGDPAENNYDVKYVKLDLKMTNTATTLSGCATTKAKVLTSSLNQYVFELIPDLTIDSVLINGIPCTLTTSGDVRTATMASTLAYGTIFTAQVFYHGTPVSSSYPFGIYSNVEFYGTYGTNVTFTLSESYHAKEWWPCKQSLQDKIDSSDVWITVDTSLKAGSNGILNRITVIDSTHVRYEWKERYPIDYYLISATVATYRDYSYYMHFTGSTDSMKVQNYIYSSPPFLTSFKNLLDSTGLMIDYFSTIYGRYPFWQEKYGHCFAPLGGGMEHQTMTTIDMSMFQGNIIAHELSHQWFGDNVTCRTWSNIFVNEGMASYSEDLFYDHFHGHAAMFNDIYHKQIDVKSYDTGTIFCPDTNENRVFDYRLSYEKGACVLHMLRFVVNNDSLFFAAYRLYQHNLADSTGTILDLKNSFENILCAHVNGVNLDTFFNQWCFLQGFPVYTVSWNQVGHNVFLRIIQNGSVPASVPIFTLPIDIVLQSSTMDTAIRILNNADTQDYYFTWDKTVINFYFDPACWLIYRLNGFVTNDTLLNLTRVVTDYIPVPPQVYPNPSDKYWQVSNLPLNAACSVYDLNSRKVWEGTNGQNTVIDIPSGQLQPGLYFLQINYSENGSKYYKLIRN